MMGRKIYFQAPLSDVKSVDKKDDNQQFIINFNDGSDCTSSFDTFFDSRDKWMLAISEAVVAGEPDAKIAKEENSVSFERG